MRKLWYVYAYLDAQLNDPWAGSFFAPPAWMREVRVEREEGWYLIARLKAGDNASIKKMNRKYKRLKVVEREGTVPPDHVGGDMPNADRYGMYRQLLITSANVTYMPNYEDKADEEENKSE